MAATLPFSLTLTSALLGDGSGNYLITLTIVDALSATILSESRIAAPNASLAPIYDWIRHVLYAAMTLDATVANLPATQTVSIDSFVIPSS